MKDKKEILWQLAGIIFSIIMLCIGAYFSRGLTETEIVGSMFLGVGGVGMAIGYINLLTELKKKTDK